MLTLPIKKKWFDMIVSGEKKEEYREITAYYQVRFENLVKNKCQLRNGYGKNRQTIIINFDLNIGFGRKEWGAEPNKQYYILKITG